MKRSDRTDILTAALTASLVVHVVLMVFIAPRVMSHADGSLSKGRRRESMNVAKAPPPREMLKLELLKDLPASREAPTAEIADLGMAAAFVPIPEREPGRTASRPEAPKVSPEFAPVDEAAPVFAEAIKVVERIRTVSPLPETLAASFVPKAEAAPRIGKCEAGVPPPVVSIASAIPPAPTVGSDVARLEDPRAEASREFTPAKEVFDQVDENVVEAEKQAVRLLVDSDSARSLSDGVNCRLTRQDVGGWTYFRLDVTPKPGVFASVPKDVVLLLDASGSIGTERLVSCRKAAKRLLRTAMNTGDRFNLVAFRDRFSYAFRSWQDCTVSAYEAADRWLSNQAPYGRTDVFSTISSVLTLPRDPKRPIVAVVVTDGDANMGVSKTAEILSRFSALNDGLVSVYMYGVRSSSNVELIDVLTRGNRGESVVHEGSRWSAGEGLEGLAERFRDPVLTDPRLVFSANCPAVAYPPMLKNLYLGNSIQVVGRVPANTGDIAFSLRGQRAGTAYESFFRLPLASAGVDEGLPRLFADEAGIDAKLR